MLMFSSVSEDNTVQVLTIAKLAYFVV